MKLGSPIKEENLESLVEAIFQGGDVKVYEAYSIPDHEIRDFNTKDEVMNFIHEKC